MVCSMLSTQTQEEGGVSGTGSRWYHADPHRACARVFEWARRLFEWGRCLWGGEGRCVRTPEGEREGVCAHRGGRGKVCAHTESERGNVCAHRGGSQTSCVRPMPNSPSPPTPGRPSRSNDGQTAVKSPMPESTNPPTRDAQAEKKAGLGPEAEAGNGVYDSDSADKEIMFRYCCHTGFVSAGLVRLHRSELDLLPASLLHPEQVSIASRRLPSPRPPLHRSKLHLLPASLVHCAAPLTSASAPGAVAAPVAAHASSASGTLDLRPVPRTSPRADGVCVCTCA